MAPDASRERRLAASDPEGELAHHPRLRQDRRACLAHWARREQDAPHLAAERPRAPALMRGWRQPHADGGAASVGGATADVLDTHLPPGARIARRDPVDVPAADGAGRLWRREADPEMGRRRPERRVDGNVQASASPIGSDGARDSRNRHDPREQRSPPRPSTSSRRRVYAHHEEPEAWSSGHEPTWEKMPSRQGGGRWFEPSIAH